jgi:hypothetical protein
VVDVVPLEPPLPVLPPVTLLPPVPELPLAVPPLAVPDAPPVFVVPPLPDTPPTPLLSSMGPPRSELPQPARVNHSASAAQVDFEILRKLIRSFLVSPRKG